MCERLQDDDHLALVPVSVVHSQVQLAMNPNNQVCFGVSSSFEPKVELLSKSRIRLRCRELQEKVTRELSELLENSVQPSNMRISIPLGPIVVSVFEPHWLLKEKIRIQHEQVRTMKERTDLEDISRLWWPLTQSPWCSTGGNKLTTCSHYLRNTLI